MAHESWPLFIPGRLGTLKVHAMFCVFINIFIAACLSRRWSVVVRGGSQAEFFAAAVLLPNPT
jgi:hypothetical protein